MRTVFLGTSEFAVTVLEHLARSPHRPSLVLTRPDRPRGRGRRLSAPPVAAAAKSLGLEVGQPQDVNAQDSRQAIAAAAPEVVCVCAFGALVGKTLLAAHRMLNVHPSALPRWRGAAPIERALMAGDQDTAVSIMELTAGLDSGPVCAQTIEPIAPEDTYGTLAPRLAALGGELLVRALDEQPPCQPQSSEGVTYAEKITSDDRQLRAERPAAELERVVRALSPHVGAFLVAAEVGRLGVLSAAVLPDDPTPPGMVDLTRVRPVFGTAAGALELITVQPPGKRPMGGEEFLRGRRVP